MYLHKNRNDTTDGKAGQIVISLLLLNDTRLNNNSNHNYESIDTNNENVNEQQSLSIFNDNNGLPEHWEERKTRSGLTYYVNHNDR